MTSTYIITSYYNKITVFPITNPQCTFMSLESGRIQNLYSSSAPAFQTEERRRRVLPESSTGACISCCAKVFCRLSTIIFFFLFIFYLLISNDLNSYNIHKHHFYYFYQFKKYCFIHSIYHFQSIILSSIMNSVKYNVHQ